MFRANTPITYGIQSISVQWISVFKLPQAKLGIDVPAHIKENYLVH